MFVQGDMHCGSLSEDLDGEASEHSMSPAASNPLSTCQLCQTPSGINDGKPSPWMWSRSISFKAPDNPFG